ncbi:MAG: hypothetical protein ACOCQD_00810 [archaeon]
MKRSELVKQEENFRKKAERMRKLNNYVFEKEIKDYNNLSILMSMADLLRETINKLDKEGYEDDRDTYDIYKQLIESYKGIHYKDTKVEITRNQINNLDMYPVVDNKGLLTGGLIDEDDMDNESYLLLDQTVVVLVDELTKEQLTKIINNESVLKTINMELILSIKDNREIIWR